MAAVGYVALYSAGNGPEAYAAKHALRFGFEQLGLDLRDLAGRIGAVAGSTAASG